MAVYMGALFAFMLLSQRVAAPLTAMARLVNQFDEARIAVAVIAVLSISRRGGSHRDRGTDAAPG